MDPSDKAFLELAPSTADDGMPESSKRANGREFHVSDCYVWAEIYYLDSATDYKECLSRNVNHPPALKDDGLVLLDSGMSTDATQRMRSVTRASVPLLIILLLLALSMHC